MAKSAEAQPGGEKKGRFLNAWKRFNKVTGFIWLALGATVNPAFYGAAAIDFGQNYLIKRWQERGKKPKAAKKMGHVALAGT